MQAPSLTGAAVSLATYREHAKQGVIKMLKSIPQGKAIVVEKSLSGPLGLIVEPQALRENGVEEVSYLREEGLNLKSADVIFLCHPDVKAVRMVASHVQRFKEAGQQKVVRLALAPRVTPACERVLEESGVYDDVTVIGLPVDLVPYDDDVMTMEMPNCFKDSIVSGDVGSVTTVARSLFNLQAMCGIIPKVHGKGRLARLAFEISNRLINEADGSVFPSACEISSLVLIDREVDLVTPMLTPLTYEGLVDEFLGIESNVVDVPAELVPDDRKKNADGKSNVKMYMNSNDQVFAGIRDVNFAALGQTLNQRARMIKDFEAARQNLNEIGEIKTYVKKLKDMNVPQEKSNMALHTNVGEFLSKQVKEYFFSRRLAAEQGALDGSSMDNALEYAEDTLFRVDDPYDSLRLLCLLSLTGNGLKRFEDRRKDVLHAYGYEFLPGLYNLEKSGILRKQDGRGNWGAIRKAFKLMVDVNEVDPNDPGYVFSGYCPVSVRVIEHAVKGAWKSIEESLKLLPGQAFEERQAVSAADMGSYSGSNSKKVVAVFFIGGVTFAEISALRWLGRFLNVEFLILTTKVINGKTFLKSVIAKDDE